VGKINGAPASIFPDATDVYAMTPEQATAELSRLTQEFNGPPPSATPSTPAEANARLTALRSDKSFYDKLMHGDTDTRREWDRLTELVSRDNRLDAAMSPNPEFPLMETMDKDHLLSTRHLHSAVEWLRESGLRDDVIRELFSGRPVSAEEQRAVEQFRAMRFSNSEWVRKLMNGDHDAKRELTLMSIVLSSEVEGA